MKVVGAVRGWTPGYGSLNADGSLICDGVHCVSNLEWIIRLRGSMYTLGAPLGGDAIGYSGGGSLAIGHRVLMMKAV